MSFPSFMQFRRGTPLELSSGMKVSYDALIKLGLQDFYVRILHDLASKDELTDKQLEKWLNALRSSNRDAQRAVKAELDARRVVPELKSEPSVAAPRRTRTRTEKVVRLMSRGDHRRAVREALGMKLTPVQVPAHTLKPGQSPEAHTVQAPESLARKLITSGDWKSVD
jgi:hypothetical protein